jgi:hypothetical protein
MTIRPPDVPNNPNPATAANATVVIVTGGASERTRWSSEARQYYGVGAYIYNDVYNAQQLADKIALFPNGSIHKLVIGGHGTGFGRVGVQPTNNDTYAPAGAGAIDNTTIDAAMAATISARIANDGWVEIQSCGGNEGSRINDIPEAGGKALANKLHRWVRFAVGTVGTWDTLRSGPKQPIPNPYWQWRQPAM